MNPGIALSDGLWQGRGCDFSRVELLLMVSCSLGRVAQTGDRDVAGFCVELAIHGARSVVACRWPVEAVEAIDFANRALSHFLEGTDKRCRRARSINAARKTATNFHTAAAFEIYGLG